MAADPRQPATGPVETEPGWRSWGARPVGDPPGWAARGWSGGGRQVPWLGVFLVLIGVALFVQAIQPQISFTSMLLVALGIAFGAAWLVGGFRAAFVPAVVLLAIAAARLVGELGYLTGSGWTPLFLGAAFLLAWVVGRVQRVRRDWALWVGAILLLIGLAQVSDRIPGLPNLGLLWPLVIIAVGGLLLVRARRRLGPDSA